MPSAVERKELQQFPVVKEVRIYCVKLGCLTCVLIMWQGCGCSIVWRECILFTLAKELKTEGFWGILRHAVHV